MLFPIKHLFNFTALVRTSTTRLLSTATSSSVYYKMPLFTTPIELLEFWFGKELLQNDMSTLKQREGLWYGSNVDFEQGQLQQEALVEGLLQQSEQYNTGLWDIEQYPQAALAKIIALDQFPRAVFRGQTKAFAGDAFTPALVRHILDKGWFEQLSYAERSFLILPMMHSEQLADHELGMELVSRVSEGGNEDIQASYKGMASFMKSHYDVVKRFNRFPHRNEALVSSIITQISHITIFSSCILRLGP